MHVHEWTNDNEEFQANLPFQSKALHQQLSSPNNILYDTII